MPSELLILIAEALVVYALVLGAHALRHRFGLAPFYALLGGLTAVMSWVTDAGVRVEAGGVIFLVGSTVFYTSLLLGVFVVYAFDGVRATRIAISTVVGVSAMVPIIAVVLNLQMSLMGSVPLGYIPSPSLRINSASVTATICDLFFLAIAWEYLGGHLRSRLGIRAFLTLLGVMWLDVILFNTMAFAGTPGFISTLTGTLVSRLVVSCFAAPILWFYISWQNRVVGAELSERPILAILQQLTEVRQELSLAQREIERRKMAEKALQASQERLQELAATDELTGLCNRRAFMDQARREVLRSQRYGHPLSLIMIDVDRFKRINDCHGHDAGDHALRELAERGRRALRSTDGFGRVGGEEFAVLLPETPLDKALEVAQRFRREVAEAPMVTHSCTMTLTVSMGVASLGEHAPDLDWLYRLADEALYRAKQKGRDRVDVA